MLSRLFFVLVVFIAFIQCGTIGTASKDSAQDAQDAVDTASESASDTIITPDLKDAVSDSSYDTSKDSTVNDVADSKDAAEAAQEIFEDIQEISDSFKDIPQVEDSFDVTEVVYPLKAGYRITEFQIKEPKICYYSGDNCIDITDAVNSELQKAIDYCKSPGSNTNELNLMGEFTVGGTDSIDLSNIDFLFGNATCICQNTSIQGCMMDYMAYPVTYDNILYKPIYMSSICSYDPQVIPECFATPEKDLALKIMGVTFGFKKAFIAGHFNNAFQNGDQITGFIKGFMPEQIAKQIKIVLPNPYLDPPTIEVTLDKLLQKDAKTTFEGFTGWKFLMNIKADYVTLMGMI